MVDAPGPSTPQCVPEEPGAPPELLSLPPGFKATEHQLRTSPDPLGSTSSQLKQQRQQASAEIFHPQCQDYKKKEEEEV